MSPLIAIAVLAVYLLVCAESYLATHAAGVFRMSFLGLGPTELRILLAVGALRAAISPWASLGIAQPMLLFDIGGMVAVPGLLIAFLVSCLRNTSALYRAEPLPERGTELRVA